MHKKGGTLVAKSYNRNLYHPFIDPQIRPSAQLVEFSLSKKGLRILLI